MSSHSRLQLHKEMMENWGDSSGVPTDSRGRGAEIEPPCQMDYYAGSSTSKGSGAPRLPVVKSSMSEAFACGLSNQLKHFRNQAGGGGSSSNQANESDDDSD